MNDKTKLSLNQLVSNTQLVRNLPYCLDLTSKHPLFIQRNNEVRWVLLSLEEYEKITRKKGKDKC